MDTGRAVIPPQQWSNPTTGPLGQDLFRQMTSDHVMNEGLVGRPRPLRAPAGSFTSFPALLEAEYALD